MMIILKIPNIFLEKFCLNFTCILINHEKSTDNLLLFALRPMRHSGGELYATGK
jgi:hypothetical protein